MLAARKRSEAKILGKRLVRAALGLEGGHCPVELGRDLEDGLGHVGWAELLCSFRCKVEEKKASRRKHSITFDYFLFVIRPGQIWFFGLRPLNRLVDTPTPTAAGRELQSPPAAGENCALT